MGGALQPPMYANWLARTTRLVHPFNHLWNGLLKVFQSIYVFNKHYLDYDLEAVLLNLKVEPPLQPPIEG